MTSPKLNGTKHDARDRKPRFSLIPREVWPPSGDFTTGDPWPASEIMAEIHAWIDGGAWRPSDMITSCASLLCPPAPERALQCEVGRVLALGAQKYGANNWRCGFEWTRLADAALRHLDAYAQGYVNDPEFGTPHLAHAACCLLFLAEHIRSGLGVDDRRKPEPEVAPEHFELAEGAALDRWGAVFGVKRNGRSDSAYRSALRGGVR